MGFCSILKASYELERKMEMGRWGTLAHRDPSQLVHHIHFLLRPFIDIFFLGIYNHFLDWLWYFSPFQKKPYQPNLWWLPEWRLIFLCLWKAPPQRIRSVPEAILPWISAWLFSSWRNRDMENDYLIQKKPFLIICYILLIQKRRNNTF